MSEGYITKKWTVQLAFVLIGIAYVLGLGVDVMEVDAAQYAEMSLEMLKSGDYLEVFDRGKPYLDKPPLLFWLSSLSFRLFGIHNWSYKLPTLIGLLLSGYFVYMHTARWYDKKTALIALLFTLGCQGYYTFSNDVRTDGLLTFGATLAVWQLGKWMQDKKFASIALAGVGVGIGMLAKGPLGLIIPGAAIFTQIALTNSWRRLLSIQIIVPIVVVAIMLAPMVYGLYTQYGPKGPTFYFWTQSFGRITGENEWKNGGSPWFLLHTYAWAALPFITFLFGALIFRFQLLAKRQNLEKYDWLTLGALVLPFLALGASKYMLSHYIFPLLPFGAILAASYVSRAVIKKSWLIVHSITLLLVGLAGITLIYLLVDKAFPEMRATPFIIVALLTLVAINVAYIREFPLYHLAIAGVITIAGVNIVMAGYIYPRLLKFQAQNEIARQYGRDVSTSFYTLDGGNHSMDFYSQRNVEDLYDSVGLAFKLAQNKPFYLYTTKKNLSNVKNWSNSELLVAEQHPHHNPALLSIPFLNPRTRQDHIDSVYLLQYTP